MRSAVGWMMLVAWCAVLTAQAGSPPPAIGRLLSSDPVSIEGRATWTSGKEDLEDPSPLVFSGTKITMQAGIALLQMEDSGGVAGFCGRTSLSLMRSKNTMLYAMNSGTISLDLSSSTTDRVLTPDLAVEWKPIAAGKKQGVVSVDSRGGLCVQNFAGSVKIFDLLNGQSLDLPAGSSVQLQSGQALTARISKDLDCGCTKSVPLGAAVTPLTSGQANPGAPSPEPAAAPPPIQAVPTPQKPPPASAPVTVQRDPPPANINPPRAERTDPHEPRVSPPGASPTPASPPPAQNTPSAPEGAGAKAPAENAPVVSATMAVSAENLPKSAGRKTFGQKVKNFFRTIFFMKKKAPAPASESN